MTCSLQPRSSVSGPLSQRRAGPTCSVLPPSEAAAARHDRPRTLGPAHGEAAAASTDLPRARLAQRSGSIARAHLPIPVRSSSRRCAAARGPATRPGGRAEVQRWPQQAWEAGRSPLHAARAPAAQLALACRRPAAHLLRQDERKATVTAQRAYIEVGTRLRGRPR